MRERTATDGESRLGVASEAGCFFAVVNTGHALITQTGSRFRRRAVRLLPAIATDEEVLTKLIELGIA